MPARGRPVSHGARGWPSSWPAASSGPTPDPAGRTSGRGGSMAGLIIDGMAVRVSSPILIGRASEVERLRAAFRRTIDGETTATLIAGEAGVGKTRLISEIASFAEEQGGTVL